jgi:hypothetical protein
VQETGTGVTGQAMTDIFFASDIKVIYRSLDLPNVFSLRPLRPLDDVKTDAISLGEGLETLARDR